MFPICLDTLGEVGGLARVAHALARGVRGLGVPVGRRA